MGAGFGAAPAAMPPAFSAPVSGGLEDLFDLGGGVGMPLGSFCPPKTVSLNDMKRNITQKGSYLTLNVKFFIHFRFGSRP